MVHRAADKAVTPWLQVLFVGDGLAIVEGLENDAPIGTLISFVSGATGWVHLVPPLQRINAMRPMLRGATPVLLLRVHQVHSMQNPSRVMGYITPLLPAFYRWVMTVSRRSGCCSMCRRRSAAPEAGVADMTRRQWQAATESHPHH